MENRISTGMANPDFVEGLTPEEATIRLTQYGYNEVPDKRTRPILPFVR